MQACTINYNMTFSTDSGIVHVTGVEMLDDNDELVVTTVLVDMDSPLVGRSIVTATRQEK